MGKNISVGKRVTLNIAHLSSMGAHLDVESGNIEDNILIPQSQCKHRELKVGDTVDVYIYRDSSDRVTASLEQDIPQVGELALLPVVDTTKFGAFLNSGLPKDVLIPKGQETCRVKVGRKYLVALYEDEKGRLCATMRLFKHLHPNRDYAINQQVTGTVYRADREMGVFVAIEDTYFGLIPRNEVFQEFEVGSSVTARVVRVREDGKIDLSPRQPAHLQMEDDGVHILEYMKRTPGGSLGLSDKSDPRHIRERFGISKSAFKKAMGGLLRQGLVRKTGSGYALTKTEE